MRAIDVLKHLLAKAESETPEGHRLIELRVPVDIVREIISAQPERKMQCNFCNMSICTLEGRACSRQVVKND